jgi:hypothetical protein
MDLACLKKMSFFGGSGYKARIQAAPYNSLMSLRTVLKQAVKRNATRSHYVTVPKRNALLPC